MLTGCILSACGGGGGSTASATSSAAQSSPTDHPVSTPAITITHKCAGGHCYILWRGDSINRGCDANNDPVCPTSGAVGTPAQLAQAQFDSDPSTAGKVTIIDHSAPGSTFDNDINGTGPFANSLATDISSSPVVIDDVVSDSLINDQYLGGQTPTQYAQSELRWAKTVQSFNAVPIVIESTELCRKDEAEPLTLQFDETSDILGAQNNYPVIPLFSAWINHPNWQTALMSVDCTHPSAAGYAFREAQIFPQLLAIVREQKGL